MPTSAEFELRTLKNEAEVKEIWEISQSIYGDVNVEFNKVVSWWKCYPNAVYVLFQDATIVGYLSMWPVKQQTFRDIIAGKRRERELSVQSILGKRSQKPRAYWYITNIVIRSNFRKTEAIKVLLREAMRRWVIEANLNASINVCALAFSKQGEALLKRFGFSKYKDAEETQDKLPVYLYTASLEDLDRIASRLDGR